MKRPQVGDQVVKRSRRAGRVVPVGTTGTVTKTTTSLMYVQWDWDQSSGVTDSYDWHHWGTSILPAEDDHANALCKAFGGGE